MADRTISVTVERLQERCSNTPGYRPGDKGSEPLAPGEKFTNFPDGIYQIGEAGKSQSALPERPLVPRVDDVLGLREIVDAKAALGHTLVADQNYSCALTDVQVGIKPLTAPRTISLPDVDAFPFGQDLVIADESGACSDTLTITVQPGAGTGDIIGGPDGATLILLSSPYQSVRFRRGAANLWIRL